MGEAILIVHAPDTPTGRNQASVPRDRILLTWNEVKVMKPLPEREIAAIGDIKRVWPNATVVSHQETTVFRGKEFKQFRQRNKQDSLL